MLLRIFLAVLGVALVSTSGSGADLAGVWKLEVTYSPNRSRVSILQLEETSTGIQGKLRPHTGPSIALDRLGVDEDQIAFDVSREWGGRTFVARYEGALEGDALRGLTEIDFRGRQRTFDWTAVRTTSVPVSDQLAPAPVAADLPLTAANFEAWRDHILPTAEELAWTEIPWLPTFSEGILAAEAADKPLLFWAMNGHPLGCT